jgi:hypothetical protein
MIVRQGNQRFQIMLDMRRHIGTEDGVLRRLLLGKYFRILLYPSKKGNTPVQNKRQYRHRNTNYTLFHL